MDIYVASSARRSVTHTQSLLERVKENSDIRAFFPAHLGDYTGSEERMRYIENIGDKHIKKADIMIAVYPFGLSVSNEIGRFIVYRKSSLGTKRKLIIWDTSIPGSEEYMLLRTEAMIMPHVDHMVSDIDQLISLLV